MPRVLVGFFSFSYILLIRDVLLSSSGGHLSLTTGYHLIVTDPSPFCYNKVKNAVIWWKCSHSGDCVAWSEESGSVVDLFHLLLLDRSINVYPHWGVFRLHSLV